MNLYSIESIHLKTSKEKRKKEMNKRTYTTTTTKKNKVSVRSGEGALLLGSLGLLGWRSKEVTKKEEGKKNIKDKSGVKIWWN